LRRDVCFAPGERTYDVRHPGDRSRPDGRPAKALKQCAPGSSYLRRKHLTRFADPPLKDSRRAAATVASAEAGGQSHHELAAQPGRPFGFAGAGFSGAQVEPRLIRVVPKIVRRRLGDALFFSYRTTGASAEELIIRFETPLSVRPARSSHPIRTMEPSVFGELSRFLLSEFQERIKFTVHSIPHCVRADLIEKSVGIGIRK
jgi:hypothetical protein